MRTLIWFAYFWSYIVLLIPKMLGIQKAVKKTGSLDLPFVKRVVNTWARRLLRLAGADITVEGIENIPKNTPVLFAGNHSGYFDIPLLLGYLDEVHPIVAKKEIAKIPLINRWMKFFDCMFIDRENPRQSVAVLNEAAQLIEKGHSVSIFPEGTRAKDGNVGEFKSGAFKIAAKTNAPVVPVVIKGTRNLMENNNYFIRPAKVKMVILPPVAVEGLSKAELKALPQQVQQLIQQQLIKM